jgi:transcriptional regulator with XRE-family HTH domain
MTPTPPVAEPVPSDDLTSDTERAWLATVGRRLRLARLDRRETQAELAARAGVNRLTVGFLERADHPAAGLVLYRRLADALGLSLEDLLGPTSSVRPSEPPLPSPPDGTADTDPDAPAYLRAVGGRVRHLRHQRDLSQTELATAAGMRQGFLSKIERGVTGMNVGLLYDLAGALGVAPSDLADVQAQMTGCIAEMTGYCSTVTTDDDTAAFLRAFGQHLRRERQRRRLSRRPSPPSSALTAPSTAPWNAATAAATSPGYRP